MEDNPSTSQVDSTAYMAVKRWTQSLQFLPEFTYEILKKYLGPEISASNNPGGAYKQKKLGYQLFKESMLKRFKLNQMYTKINCVVFLSKQV